METKTLPNSELVQFLYNKYYAQHQDPRASYMSSYWQASSDAFDVRMDRGHFSSLKGNSFGDIMERDTIERLVKYIGHLFYLTMLPQRCGIVALMGPAWQVCRRWGAA